MSTLYATHCRHCGVETHIDRLDARAGAAPHCVACEKPLLIGLTDPFVGISPIAWEHPRDRAALNALRALPGLPALIRWVGGWLADSNLRLRFLQSAIHVGPRQFPKLHERMRFVARRLDLGFEPDLFVAQSPTVNAFAAGLDKPIICVQSGLLEMLDDDGVTAVLAHEAAHIKSGHMLYRATAMALLLLLSRLGFVARALNLAQLPLMVALLDWYRCSELSADRAELIATGRFDVPIKTILRMAGGRKVLGEEADAEAFLDQARRLDDLQDESLLHRLYILLQSWDRTHPFAVYRARELDRFSQSDDFLRILEGRYAREPEKKPLPTADAKNTDIPGDDSAGATPPTEDPFAPAPEGNDLGRTWSDGAADAWSKLADIGRDLGRNLGGVGRDVSRNLGDVASRLGEWLKPRSGDHSSSEGSNDDFRPGGDKPSGDDKPTPSGDTPGGDKPTSDTTGGPSDNGPPPSASGNSPPKS